MFHFPNHTLKLKAPEQPQSAGEESHLTCDITQLLVQRFKFFIKIENNVFPKHILKSKAHDQSNQARKKLICHVVVKNYLSNISLKFFIKIESTWRHKIKEQAPQLALLYRGRTIRSSRQKCCIKKLFLEILQYPQETPVLEPIFKRFADLQTCTFVKNRPQQGCLPVNIAKFLILLILKNICKPLLFHFFMVHSYIDLKL